MPIKAVIFDMDGLLFDTETAGRWAWEQALDSHGYTMTDAIYREFIGRDMAHRGHVLKTHFGPQFPFESVKAMRIAIGDRKEIEQGLDMKPGVIPLLKILNSMEIQIGLGTGTVRERTLRRLAGAGLQHYFRAIVAGDEVQNGKPSPGVFLEVSNRLGVPPHCCLVFEDSGAGIRAAASAGMRAVMVPDLEHPTKEVERLAYCVLPSLETAIGILPELFGRTLPDIAVEKCASP